MMEAQATTQEPVNPWRAVWMRPREAVRAALDHRPVWELYALSVAGGFVMSLYQMDGSASLWEWLLISPVAGVLGLLWYSLIFGFSCLFFGGSAGPRAIQTAIAWALPPLLPILALSLLYFGLFGSVPFARWGEPAGSAAESLARSGFKNLSLVLLAWSGWIFFSGLAEVQGFSFIRAVASVLFPPILLAVAFLCLEWFVI